jgi:hypothetical protein
LAFTASIGIVSLALAVHAARASLALTTRCRIPRKRKNHVCRNVSSFEKQVEGK